MMTKRLWKWIAMSLVLAATAVCTALTLNLPSSSEMDRATQESVDNDGRWEYLYNRLVDPRTGEIPPNIRMREMVYASRLPRADVMRDSIAVDFKSIGPYNVGGRTRAIAIDRLNPDTYIVGGVTGGIWRTTDAGQSWTNVTRSMDHPATSYIIQDPRNGKNETWYYGSGETIGNSASKSFSAIYRGSGIWKSMDNGVTWNHLQSTGPLQHKSSDWEVIHNLCMDPTRNDSDIVFAAMKKGIARSSDGGETWKIVLRSGSSCDFSRVSTTTDGVFYASISSDASANRGFWRSTDGFDWVKISPSALAGSHRRTVIAVAPSNEKIVFFYSYAPSAGVNGGILWRYEYIDGDGTGSGGDWQNRTSGLASSSFSMQGGYNMALGVKPDDEDVLFLGNNNLYRSNNAFADTFQVNQIGGYSIDGDSIYNYFNGGGKHYPDQQNLAFRPDDSDVLISTTDAGVHVAQNCMLDTMQWEGLLNGYNVTQFYGIAIDQGTMGSEVAIGGTQDRGTHWTNVADEEHLWTHVRGGDGAYCEVEDGGGHYYISTQYANIERCEIASNGQKNGAYNVMPKQVNGGYLFVHPFTLDRADNDIMYLPNGYNIWRNTKITETDSATLFSDWKLIASLDNGITAISSSPSDAGIVYVGTSSGKVFRLDSAHVFESAQVIPASDSISNGGYTSCIAVHPFDPMKAIAVFSNYNCRSIWYTEDGGADWVDIEGNLAGETDPGVPESLWFIGNGPSLRWASFVPTGANSDVYFVSTSVGVFSTAKLEGENTEWVMQGSQTMGNAVVDMLKYRGSDGWLVAGTHGKGMYAGHVSLIDTTTPPTPEGVAEMAAKESMSIFPNPSNGLVTLQLQGFEAGEVKAMVYDQVGREVKHFKLNIQSVQAEPQLDLKGLRSGTYYLEVKQGAHWVIEPLVIR